jgi:hypothetical protein
VVDVGEEKGGVTSNLRVDGDSEFYDTDQCVASV